MMESHMVVMLRSMLMDLAQLRSKRLVEGTCTLAWSGG